MNPKELDATGLHCRGANSSDVPTFAAVIDRAFAHRGLAGSGTSLAISIEKLSNILLIYREQEGGQQILGACPIREYPCHFGPTTLVAGGLSLVAVDPVYQRRGVGQKMLACAEEHMYRTGFDIGFLFTGSPSFYRHAGWIQAIEAPFCELPIEITNGAEETGDPTFTFRGLQSSDVADACRLYEGFNKERPLTKVRDERWWVQRIERQGEKRHFFGAFLDGAMLGYFGLEYSGMEERRVDVVEYATTAGTVKDEPDRLLNAILSHVKKLAGQKGYHLIGTPLPATYPLSGCLRASGAVIKDAWWSPLMTLIVNVPAFVSKLVNFQEQSIIPRVSDERLSSIPDFCIGLAVEDPRGTDPVIVHYTKEGMSLSVRAGSARAPSNAVPITRQQLALAAFGNYNTRLLVENGMWACPDELIDEIGLFFPRTDGMVYPRDHF